MTGSVSWRLAKSLDRLRTQINDAYPHRSKASDGTIGDAAHSSRTSDHNPNSSGVVCALDITHDPKNGMDAGRFARLLAKRQDPRIKYIISNGEICSGPGQGQVPWAWRKYTGKNPHDKHFHVSVRAPASFYDNAGDWDLQGMPAPPLETASVRVQSRNDADPMLRRGVRGDSVVKFQRLLNARGAKLRDDGEFGAKTEAALKKFQKAAGIVPDGVCGPYTWAALRKL